MGWLSRLFNRRKSVEDTAQLLSPEEYFSGNEAWTSVQSSTVHSIAYYGRGPTGELRVRFKDDTGKANAEYYYRGVPHAVYADMLDASSKGKFVWSVLRGGRRHGGDRYDYGVVWKA